MEQSEAEALKNLHRYFEENLYIDRDLWASLKQNGVVDPTITFDKDQQRRLCEELMTSLHHPNRSSNTFSNFVDALKKSHNDHLAERLEKEFQNVRLGNSHDTNHNRNPLINPILRKKHSHTKLQRQLSAHAISIEEIPSTYLYYTLRVKLKEKLEPILADVERKFICLSGVHGCGKTQLARHLAHNLAKTFSDNAGVRYEIPCRKLQQFLPSISRLRSSLNLVDNETQGADDSEESARRMIHQIFERLERSYQHGFHHVIILDDVAEETHKIITTDLLLSVNFQVIITTNSSLWYHHKDGYHLKVDGFDDVEANLLVQAIQSSDNDAPLIQADDIKMLNEQVSGLPLGLVVAVKTMQAKHLSVDEYLHEMALGVNETPDVHCEDMKSPHKEGFMKTLISGLSSMREYLKKNVCNGDNNSDSLFDAFSLCAFTNNSRIPLKWLMKSLIQPEDVGELIKAIKVFSLGYIYTEDENNLLDLHLAVQTALSIYIKEHTSRILKTALHQVAQGCSKDTRYRQDMDFYKLCLSHVVSVLGNVIEHNSSGILEIESFRDKHSLVSLYLFGAHMYSQLNLPEVSSLYINEVLSYFFKYFLPGEKMEAVFSIDCSDPYNQSITSDLKHLIADWCGCLKKINISSDDIEDIVLKQRYSEEDERIWNAKCTVKPILFLGKRKMKLAKLRRMTPTYYKKLIEHKAALSIEKIKEIFLMELLASIFYTAGRMYFYKKSKKYEKLDKDRSRSQSWLHAAHEIGKYVRKNHSVYLMIELLSQRYGILYFHYELENKSPDVFKKSVREAIDTYKILEKEHKDHFEGGLLKMSYPDVYHVNVCKRQILRGYTHLLDQEREPLKKEKIFIEGSTYARDFQAEQQTNETSFMNQKARFLLHSKERKDHDLAIMIIKEVVSKERESRCMNYPWLEALTMSIQLVQMQMLSKQEVIGWINQYKEAIVMNDLDGYTDEIKRADEMIKSLVNSSVDVSDPKPLTFRKSISKQIKDVRRRISSSSDNDKVSYNPASHEDKNMSSNGHGD